MTNPTRVAIVTGAAAGIGAAIAKRLAQAGKDVAIWDLQVDRAQSVAEEIRAMGRKAVVSRVDVSNKSDVESALQTARKELGPITILVNNAGISPQKEFEDITEADFDTIFSVNIKGMFFITQSVIADMKAAKWGRIINISSSSAQSGAPLMSHYAATKGAVIGFTKALAHEVGKDGITVNNVPPSFVQTEGLDAVVDSIPGGIEAYAKMVIPVRRPGQPADLAAAVNFLASEEAGYITGHTLGVNGGRYMA